MPDCCPLVCVQVKTAKPHLKQLQQCVQGLSSEPDDPVPSALTANSFRWLTRSHAYITVYLVRSESCGPA